MSISLESGTEPHGLRAKTIGGAPVVGLDKTIVFLGDYQISIEDFLELAWYVLINTDLDGDQDPRLKFVEQVKGAKVITGYNGESSKRLKIPWKP